MMTRRWSLVRKEEKMFRKTSTLLRQAYTHFSVSSLFEFNSLIALAEKAPQ